MFFAQAFSRLEKKKAREENNNRNRRGRRKKSLVDSVRSKKSLRPLLGKDYGSIFMHTKH